MKSEPDEFSIDDLAKVGTRTLERRAQLPGAQFHARWHAGRRRHPVLPLQLPPCPASSAWPKSSATRVSGPDPVRARSPITTTRRASREEPRWFLVDVGFERKLKRVDHPGRAQGARRRAGRFRPAPARQPPVGAAGDRGAVANHPLTRIDAQDAPDVTARKRTDDARRATRPCEYVETAAIVGVGTGSTVAFFIDGPGRMKHRIDGAVSSSEQSTRQLQASTASRCSTSTPPARWPCTSTAPTNATRTSA